MYIYSNSTCLLNRKNHHSINITIFMLLYNYIKFSFLFLAVDGGLSEWGAFSECSATCGDGIKERERTCTNPVPRGAGNGCIGDLSEAVKCNLGNCIGVFW